MTRRSVSRSDLQHYRSSLDSFCRDVERGFQQAEYGVLYDGLPCEVEHIYFQFREADLVMLREIDDMLVQLGDHGLERRQRTD